MDFQLIKQTVGLLDDPVARLEFVMELGKKLPEIPPYAQCTEIKGCASFVQICRDGDKFFASADSVLVRGIVAIIMAMVDGKSVEEIKKMNMHQEFENLNLNLGAGRLNGVDSMIRFFQNL